MANDNAHWSKEADGSKELAPEVQDRIVLKFNLGRAAKEVIGQNSTFLQDVLKNMSIMRVISGQLSCNPSKPLSRQKSSP